MKNHTNKILTGCIIFLFSFWIVTISKTCNPEPNQYELYFQTNIDSIGRNHDTLPDNDEHRRLFAYLVDTLKFSSDPSEWTKRQKYICKFIRIAIDEMNRTGIPASVTLAQGIVESSSGESDLATSTANHFGIKCKEKGCRDEWHCCEYADDKPDDRFLNLGTPEKSFIEHSVVLSKKRYQALKKIPKGDYQTFCKMLSYAGYATNPNYANILINVIEKNNLHFVDFTTKI